MPYKDRETYLKKQKEAYHKNKRAYYWRNVKNKYGLTKEEFYDLVEKQGSSCALCRKPFKSLYGNDLHIDHCHETGKLRGSPLYAMQCSTWYVG